MTALLPATKRLIDGLFHGASSAVARTSLARSITLVESTLPRDRFQAELLLDHVLEQRKALADRTTTATHQGHATSFRIGIAGPPGAGKSTFIETLGLSLTKKGHKVAVLAIDPSSSVTGGSILGDKTRMTHLSNSPDAFVRPSPTRGTLGGVAQHTNEIVLLCEACGYDIVLVESVGLGQSEIIIDDTVDMVMLLQEGIMEIADVVVVNKADGELKTPAKHTAVDYMHALQLARRKEPEWKPTVKMCSAREGDGIDAVWDVLTEFRNTMNAVHKIEAKRARQSSKWMWNQLHQELMAMAKKNHFVKHEASTLAPDLAHGFISPRSAARKLLDDFLAHPKNN
ncbi:LAO/AO transport system ATPase [Saprolegnia parasitica CBS 223.65]|uniref:LAO/AO transport system ATPase n=1 Tax=Saprolegnia parasitica (strain CBS 223.65) TaxID=695850 RepID=A0A067CNC0_SAPPC|nr:LAO/AO transport system ATPase [Saprolegnia parasitica CBS 223.65]KDO32018.1 LAO/AO transport system ATPase [Saprolegnia parasitica CBS 223.65]|eukprot:XP_012197208.1 LAO/AO transport system ATPase [Saprolegnia parasitica CBS 223.65]